MEELLPIAGTKKCLDSKEQKLFDWVQQTWEHNKYMLKTIPWNESKIKDLLKSYGILERHTTATKQIQILSTAPENTILFTTPKGKGVAKALIKHLRNAYAHLYLEKMPNTNALHIQDWHEPIKNKIMECTMEAQIPFEFLEALVEILLHDYPKLNNKTN